MRIAILIIAHKNKAQLELLIRQLQHPSFQIYLHLDKNADFGYKDIRGSYIPITKNYACSWGGYNVVKATFALLKKAYADKNDYFVLISGQDFPVKTNEQILAFFQKHQPKSFIYIIAEEEVKTEPLVDYENFIHRFQFVHVPKSIPKNILETFWFYSLKKWRWLQKRHLFLRPAMPKNIFAGENWFNLFRDDVSLLLQEYRKARWLRLRLCLGLSMEEVLPHTLLKKNLKKENWVNDSLRFTIWKPKTNHPENLNENNLDEIIDSEDLFARKFEDLNTLLLLSARLSQD